MTQRWTIRLTTWLTQRWAMPAFAGWVLIGLTSCFWIAAANTLAGWLYVLSGTLLALLGLAMWLPMRSLRSLTVTRQPLYPVSVGETLSLSLQIRNASSQGRSLLQYRDSFPPHFSPIGWKTLAAIDPKSSQTFNLATVPQKRGQFRWSGVELRTAAPLGLFWAQRHKAAPAHVMIYPEHVPLSTCPLIEALTSPELATAQEQTFAHLGQHGTTRSLRPYRRGDAMRLIHWRTSARFNELRTRELEVLAGDCPVTIALDTPATWTPENFESAVVAATSLFQFALQHGYTVRLWTPKTGIQQGLHSILETLALVQAGESGTHAEPQQPTLWLTTNPHSIASLPLGSRSILWRSQLSLETDSTTQVTVMPTFTVTADQDLRSVLQRQL